MQIKVAQILAQDSVDNVNIKTVLCQIQNHLFELYPLSSTQIIKVAALLLPENYLVLLPFIRGEKLLNLALDGTVDPNIRCTAANLLGDSDIKARLLQELPRAINSMEELD